MVSLAGIHLRRQIFRASVQQNFGYGIIHPFLSNRIRRVPRFSSSSSAESAQSKFIGENAYDILGVTEISSLDQIKASFRKLAKETHPDLAQSRNASAASQRFVQILAAYEILSDSEKRAHYDSFLLIQKQLIQKHNGQRSTLSMYKSHQTTVKEMEVVEWLKWYRHAINDILSEKRVVVGSGYFDVLERDFCSAIHAAFYGPVIESMELLPDRFEAEERSMYETNEVLHLVSGRDLFGMVCLADRNLQLSSATSRKLTSSTFECLGTGQRTKNSRIRIKLDREDDLGNPQMSDAYRDLELHVSGRVVAVATRIPPKSYTHKIKDDDAQDHIHVFLSPHYDSGPRIPLGTIVGLGTSPDEGSCFVSDNSGTKTHIIMKHRTLMVKHMHWYCVGDEVSVCECRCSRAHLPPSRFWLFEPRCGMHDIGGWYVETFGRDKKGKTVPSQRYWDGLDASVQTDR